MRVDRRVGAERLVDAHVLGRVGVVVGAADDVGDPRVDVVDDDREVVDRRPVGARDHEVVEQRVLELGLAAHDVVDHRHAVVGHAQPDGALALVGRRGSRGCRGSPCRREPRRRPPWCGTRLPSSSSCWTTSRMALGVVGLVDRALVPIDAQPLQRAEDLLDVLPAWSARGRCPRCAARAGRPSPAPGASCTVPSSRCRCAARRSATEESALSWRQEWQPRPRADRRARLARRRAGECH